MKIKKLTRIGTRPVFDISVKDAEHYVLENGVVTHNTGILYSADTVFVFGRQQEKDSEGVSGYNFVINIEKSRFTREKSKIPLQVLHSSGINKWSALLDIALELNFVVKPSNGWYSRVDDDGVVEDKKWRANDTNSSTFWNLLVNSPKFKQAVSDRYKIGTGSIMNDDEIDQAMDSIGGDDAEE